MKKTKKTKYTTILWEDHCSDSAWKNKNEIKLWATKPTICTTTGEITYEDKKVIVLSASFDGDEAWGESMCILKKNIIKIL
jgi:hypothetical protein